MDVKVWLSGEGANELGGRAYDPPRDTRGVLEALLRRVCARGWHVEGATLWRGIRKFKAGAGGAGHADFRNALGVILRACEAACEVVAFSRDADADPERASAVAQAMETVATWATTDPAWRIAIIGGIARPCLEAWLAALQGVGETDEMSRRRAAAALAEHDVETKSTEDYVAMVERARLGAAPGFGLPPGTESLRAWLEVADRELNLAVSGE